MGQGYLLVALLLLYLACMSDAIECRVTVYFLPLEMELYVPPTSAYLREYGTHIDNEELRRVCELTTHVRGLLKSDVLTGQEKRIRVLVVDELTGDEFVITAERQIITSQRVYDVAELTFERAMTEIIERVDAIEGYK